MAEQLAKQKKYGVLRIESAPEQAVVIKDGEKIMVEFAPVVPRLQPAEGASSAGAAPAAEAPKAEALKAPDAAAGAAPAGEEAWYDAHEHHEPRYRCDIQVPGRERRL